ncbi:MAG: peptidyl-prolyl cis-trans isomerase [Flavobacteriaceae bacterium]
MKWLYSLILLMFFCICSCGKLLNGSEDQTPIARVGDTYLYKQEVEGLVSEDMTPGDSAAFMTNFINNWATRQLLLSKANINLPEDKLEEFNRLVEDYRTDLYTRAYKEALVSQGQDTTVSEDELKRFYELQKENFRLKEKILRLRFVEIPLQFLNKDEVISSLKGFEEDDRYYLDSVGIQFRKLNFNDSLWVPVSRVMQEIPPLNADNEDRYLKKSQFFELQDPSGVYLVYIKDILQVNEIAPLPYVEPRIRQVILNRRKLDFIKKLETEIIDEATKENEFEIFE